MIEEEIKAFDKVFGKTSYPIQYFSFQRADPHKPIVTTRSTIRSEAANSTSESIVKQDSNENVSSQKKLNLSDNSTGSKSVPSIETKEESKPVIVCQGKYCVTKFIPKPIEEVLQLNGLEKCDNNEDVSLIIGFKPPDEIISQTSPHTRINHYEHAFALGTKSGLHNLMKQKNVIFYPQSFYLPFEKLEFEQNYTSSSIWIQKPAGRTHGIGINLISSTQPIPELSESSHVVMQKYIPNPIVSPVPAPLPSNTTIISSSRNSDRHEDSTTLDPTPIKEKKEKKKRGKSSSKKDRDKLEKSERESLQEEEAISGRKIDLRIYVLVPSIDPLRIYVYNDGIIRVASEDYLTNNTNISNLDAHLTHRQEEEVVPGLFDGSGNVWTLAQLPSVLTMLKLDHAKVMESIDSAITNTIALARSKLLSPNHRHSFELFGFDVLVDRQGQAFVLEVNVGPALGIHNDIEETVKQPLIADSLSLALIPKGESIHKVDKLEEGLKNPSSLPNIPMRSSSKSSASIKSKGKEVSAKVEEDPLSFTKMITACEFEIAERNKGQFRRVYPIPERVEQVQKFMELTELDNHLAEWISLSEDQKEDRLKAFYPCLLELFQ